MSDDDRRTEAHHLDVTVWVGKEGIGSVTEELRTQLEDRSMVKVKFLRAARAETSVDALADSLAEATDASVFETRGNTAVFYRGGD